MSVTKREKRVSVNKEFEKQWKKAVVAEEDLSPLNFREFTAACQKLAPTAIKYLERIISNEKASPVVRLKAVEIILERGYGKAIQPTANLEDQGAERPVIVLPAIEGGTDCSLPEFSPSLLEKLEKRPLS